MDPNPAEEKNRFFYGRSKKFNAYNIISNVPYNIVSNYDPEYLQKIQKPNNPIGYKNEMNETTYAFRPRKRSQQNQNKSDIFGLNPLPQNLKNKNINYGNQHQNIFNANQLQNPNYSQQQNVNYNQQQHLHMQMNNQINSPSGNYNNAQNFNNNINNQNYPVNMESHINYQQNNHNLNNPQQQHNKVENVSGPMDEYENRKKIKNPHSNLYNPVTNEIIYYDYLRKDPKELNFGKNTLQKFFAGKPTNLVNTEEIMKNAEVTNKFNFFHIL